MNIAVEDGKGKRETEMERKWSTAGACRLWEWKEKQKEKRNSGKKGGRESGSKAREMERDRPTKLHPSLPLLLQLGGCFVYHQASADSPPALQIKLTASATGIHYTHRRTGLLRRGEPDSGKRFSIWNDKHLPAFHFSLSHLSKEDRRGN